MESHREPGATGFLSPGRGGDALQVTTQGGGQAFESHDGRFLNFTKAGPGGHPRGIWRIPAGGGEEVQVLDRGSATYWVLTDQGILDFHHAPEPPLLTLELFR